MQKVKIEVNSQSLMSRVSRMFEQTEESMLLEVFQNARRSGATEIYLSKEGNVLTVANNGKAINDFQKLLTLGESGWDEEIDFEDPAGAGFFSVSLCDRVEIKTKTINGWRGINVNKDILSTLDAEVEVKEAKASVFSDANVEYVLHGIKLGLPLIDRYGKSIEKIAINYPCQFFIAEEGKLRGVQNIQEMHKDALEFSMEMDGVRFHVYNHSTYDKIVSINSGLNYFGHMISLKSGHAKGMGYILCIPVEGCKLRMVLPGRHTIVQNEAFNQFQKNLLIFTGKYYMEVKKGKHKLSYSFFYQIRKVLPEFPEMENPLPSKRYISPSGNEHSNLGFMVQGMDDCVEVNSYDLANWRGYSWMKDYIIIENYVLKYEGEVIFDECEAEIEVGVYPENKVTVVINGEHEEPITGGILQILNLGDYIDDMIIIGTDLTRRDLYYYSDLYFEEWEPCSDEMSYEEERNYYYSTLEDLFIEMIGADSAEVSRDRVLRNEAYISSFVGKLDNLHFVIKEAHARGSHHKKIVIDESKKSKAEKLIALIPELPENAIVTLLRIFTAE